MPTKTKKKKQKIHPLKSRSPSEIVPKAISPGQAGIPLKAELFNRVKKKVLKLAKKRPVSDDTIKRTKIRVIGIGGGAGSIVSEIISLIKKVDFVVANTDARALKLVKKAKRFQFGQSLTRGLGTGMNIELGEVAALAEKEKIKKLFDSQDLCILVACLGGGTGSGAGPIFAKLSRGSGCLTYGIFTLPFEFEGVKKMEIARESLEKIKPNLNAFSIIPNERIFQIIDKNTPLKAALSAINKKLAENLEGLIEMIYLPGLINIDFADLKTILAGCGRLTYLNTIGIETNDKAEDSKKLISSPLYPYTVKGARGILYNVSGGKDLQLAEVSQISKLIFESVNKNAKIIFGISQKSQNQKKIKITLLATSCGTKLGLFKPKPKPKPPAKPPLAPKPFLKKSRFKAKPKPKLKPRAKPTPKPKPRPTAALAKVPEISPNSLGGKVRRNGLALKMAIEQEEKEILEKEKIWETPTILRKKQIKD